MKVEQFSKHYFEQVTRIHEKHFKDEFSFDSIFDDKILNRFVIVDDDDKVITFGGIELLFEVFLVTDLDRTTRERVIALRTFLNKAITEARKKEFEQLHCFASDNVNNWPEILEKVGFSPRKGKAFYINL